MELFEVIPNFTIFDDLPTFEIYDGQNEHTTPSPPKRQIVNLNNPNCPKREKILEKIRDDLRRKKEKK
jgi:hypothetical protein